MEEEEVLEEEAGEEAGEVSEEIEEEEEYTEEFSVGELETFINITDLWVKALKNEVPVKEIASIFKNVERRHVRRKRGK